MIYYFGLVVALAGGGVSALNFYKSKELGWFASTLFAFSFALAELHLLKYTS